MLCKTTMRSALAPVLGFVGLLCATMANAAIDLGGKASENPPSVYAAETLTTDVIVGRSTAPSGYKIKATGTSFLLTATSDILLSNRGAQEHYYLRYDFGPKLVLAREAPTPSVYVMWDHDQNPATPDQRDEAEGTIDKAYRGREGNDIVIYRLSNDPNLGQNNTDDYPVGTVFSLDLSNIKKIDHDGDDTTPLQFPADAVDPTYAGLAVAAEEGTFTVRMAVYEDLSEARGADFGADIFSATGAVVTLERTVKAGIKPHLDVAEVATTVADGGPFRRFVASEKDGSTGLGGKDAGVLATVTVEVEKSCGTGCAILDASTGVVVDDDIVASTSAKATASAGDFAINTISGEVNPNTRKPFRVSSTAACSGGAMTLSGPGGATLDKYTSDPDGTDGKLVKGDLTPAGLAAATEARTSAIGNAVGESYFCVNVGHTDPSKGNMDPIPEVGDPVAMDGYMLTVTPVLADEKKHPIKPGSTGPAVAGAIDRNGTTVHIPYLSTHDAYNQRLVLVNRGRDDAAFWIDDSGFNLEDGVTLVENKINGDVPGKGRLVVRVQDHLTLTGKTRAAATIHVAAPERDIDVMTIQVHPGTGQVDTTVYQHAKL